MRKKHIQVQQSRKTERANDACCPITLSNNTRDAYTAVQSHCPITSMTRKLVLYALTSGRPRSLLRRRYLKNFVIVLVIRSNHHLERISMFSCKDRRRKLLPVFFLSISTLSLLSFCRILG